MAATYVSSTSSAYTTAAATSTTINKPTSTTSGDLLVAVLHVELTSLAAWTPPTGWTLGLKQESTPNTGYLLWRICDGTEGSAFTFTYGVAGWSVGAIHRFTGAVTSADPFRGSLVSGAGTTSPTGSLSYAPTVAGLGFWAYTSSDASTVTVPSGYTGDTALSVGSLTTAHRTDAAGSLTTGTAATTVPGGYSTFAGTIAAATTSGSLTVSAGIDADADPNLVDSFTLTATASAGTSPYTYVWADITSGTTTLTGSGASRTVALAALRTTVGSVRTYRVTVTDNVAATATDTVVVTVLPHSRWAKLAAGLTAVRRMT
jgi:hypothetical protein